MTKDQFCTYVQGILDMELEIAKIAHKTKEDIELVGALKLIQDALKKVVEPVTPHSNIYPLQNLCQSNSIQASTEGNSYSPSYDITYTYNNKN